MLFDHDNVRWISPSKILLSAKHSKRFFYQKSALEVWQRFRQSQAKSVAPLYTHTQQLLLFKNKNTRLPSWEAISRRLLVSSPSLWRDLRAPLDSTALAKRTLHIEWWRFWNKSNKTKQKYKRTLCEQFVDRCTSRCALVNVSLMKSESWKQTNKNIETIHIHVRSVRVLREGRLSAALRTPASTSSPASNDTAASCLSQNLLNCFVRYWLRNSNPYRNDIWITGSHFE